jgi:hypothetical protein
MEAGINLNTVYLINRNLPKNSWIRWPMPKAPVALKSVKSKVDAQLTGLLRGKLQFTLVFHSNWIYTRTRSHHGTTDYILTVTGPSWKRARKLSWWSQPRTAARGTPSQLKWSGRRRWAWSGCGVQHQFSLELGDVHVEHTVRPQWGGQRRAALTNETVQVEVGRSMFLRQMSHIACRT